jgi:PAS domain-containing protein
MVGAQEERKQSTLSAGKLEERFALAVEAGRIGLWEYLIDKRAFLVDRSFLDLIGIEFADQEIPEDVVLDLLELDDRDELLDLLHGDPNVWTGAFDREIKLKSGPGRWIAVRSRPIESPDGVKRLVGTVLDISNLTRYQDSESDPQS